MIIELLKHFLRLGAARPGVLQIRELIEQGRISEAKPLANGLLTTTEDSAHAKACLLGEIAFREHQDSEAEAAFRQVLLKAPAYAEAHYGLSLVLAEAGKSDLALEHALFAKNFFPENSKYLSQLGYCYMLLKGYPAAEGILRTALKTNPKDKTAWNNLAIVLRVKGLPAESKVALLQALEIDPTYKQALTNMALLDEEIAESGMSVNIWKSSVEDSMAGYQPPMDSGMPWEIIQRLFVSGEKAAALNLAESNLPEAPSTEEVCALANLYLNASEPESAVELLEGFLVNKPEEGAAWNVLGELWLTRNMAAAAIAPLQRAIGCGVEGANVHANLGSALHTSERYSEGLAEFKLACHLDPSPGFKKRMAAALTMCCEYQAAMDLYDEMLAAGDVEAHQVAANMAVCQVYLGRFEEALPLIDSIIETEAHDPAFRMMRATIHLMEERWEPGWKDYVWRGVGHSANFRTLPFSKWKGEPLEGKSIVILAEQGLGDQIMFASCLPDVLQLKPARVVVEVHQRVANTLSRSFPECEIIPTRQKKDLEWVAELGPIDYFLPLADLPLLFRKRAPDFPAVPYLKVDTKRVEFWRERLATSGPRPWIGFSWKGGTELTRSVMRTTDIDSFAMLEQRHAGTWVCLQYGNVQSSLNQAMANGFPVAYWEDAISDLDDFAALTSALDIVITVCNTTVHFAGALGKPTLVIAPRVPEWRYGRSFSHLPWYPDVQVLRQQVDSDWGSLFQTTSRLLDTKLSNPELRSQN